MIHIFSVKLISDTSAENIRRIEHILKSNKIGYTLETIRSRGSIGRAIDIRSYAASNISYGNYDETQSYVYQIWVARHNLKRAQILIVK